MDFNFDWISLVSGAFGITMVKIIWDVIKFYVKRKDDKELSNIDFELRREELLRSKVDDDEIEITEVFNDIIISGSNIHDELISFGKKYGAARICTKKISNGGGVPHLGSTQFITIVDEVILDDKIESIRDRYKKFQLTPEYTKLLKFFLIDNEESPTIMNIKLVKEIALSTLYKFNKIKSICKFKCVTMKSPDNPDSLKDGYLIYLSIEFIEDISLTIEMANDIFKIKELIRSHYKEFYYNRIKEVLNIKDKS